MTRPRPRCARPRAGGSALAPAVRAAVLLAPALLAALALPSRARAAEAPDRELADYLDRADKAYSDEHQMLGQRWTGPGYHSTVAPGTWAHPTRTSLEYATALVKRGTEADRSRAAQVVRKVLSLQDTDPQSRTYGIWPWLLEEPLAKMSPPDWNWADFCGAQLAEMLVLHPDRLPDDLREAMRASLGHAARAIRKRDVQPGYTNIAIMGGGVTAAAGEVLGDADLLAYGRDRLRKSVEHAAYHGGFNEYNSPTYTMVALREAERALHLVKDPAAREAAESLRRTAWQTIADSFHPGTRQWAGPHSRAYADTISDRLARELAERCPADLAPRFRALPQDPLQVRRTSIRAQTPEASTVGTTWLTAEACLGSVNRSSFWTQRRPLLAYWKADGGGVAVLRLRFLHDGRDFASMGVAAAQEGPRVLVLVHPLKNHGDWHISLDRPKDGRFRAKDLRLRLELRAGGATAEALAPGRFVLRAGAWRAEVHALPGRFAGRPVVWQVGRADRAAFLDAVCYEGEETVFDFASPPSVVLAAGVEVLREGQVPAPRPPTAAPGPPGRAEADWLLPGDVALRAEARW